MTKRLLLIAVEVVSPLAILSGWWVWSARHNSVYFPPLSSILSDFRHLWLFSHFTSDAVPSIERLSAGFAIATVAGIVVGLALGSFEGLRRTADPAVQFFRAIPPPALLPFGILVFGIGAAMKIFIIALVCVWPVLLNTMDGVAGIEPTLLETADAYSLRRRDRVFRVILPAAAPQIFSGMRTGLAVSILMMVVSEMVASTNGVGYFVLHAQRTFAITDMWAGMVFLGVLGYVLNVLFHLVEARVLRWHRGYRRSLIHEL